ncbi:MAG: TonB-dependent receptor [Elusimicrobiota bacterium]
MGSVPRASLALSAGVLLLLRGPASGQEPPDRDRGVRMEITAPVRPAPAPHEESTRPVARVQRTRIQESTPDSVPDALRDEPGVLVQKTMPGQPAVSVRGFIGKDNLVLIDGARLNHAATRNVQSLGTLDPDSFERVDVLRGPGSVLYGGDALGGVVYLSPKRRTDYSRPLSVEPAFFADYRSATRGRAARMEVSGNWRRLGWIAGLRGGRSEHLRTGGGRGRAVPTGYSSSGGDLALDWRTERALWTLTYQHGRQEDLARYDKYPTARLFGSTGEYDEYLFDPVSRDLVVLGAETGKGGGPALRSRVYWQRQHETRRSRKTGSSTRSIYKDTVRTIGGRLDWERPVGGAWTLLTGLEGYQDRVGSGREDVSLATGIRTDDPSGSSYPDGSTYGSLAGFTLLRWRPAQEWTLETGGRFSRVSVDSSLRSGPAAGRPFDDTFSSWTGGAGARWQARPMLRLHAGLWQGFRPPNLNDTVVLKTAASGTDVPSFGLRSEKSTGLELGAWQKAGSFSHSLTVHYTRLTDLIERVPGAFNGLSFIDEDGDGIRDPGESPVYQRANFGQGFVAGAEWEGGMSLAADRRLYAAASWTFGRNCAADEPLTRVPPPAGTLGFRWTPFLPSFPWMEVFLRGAAPQDRLSTSDRDDPRVDPAGTPGWWTLNLRGGLRLTRGMRLVVSVENALDRGYREHGSGVDAAGINVVSRLEWRR